MTSAQSQPVRIAVVAVLSGVAAGLVGIALVVLLHVIQHVAFGYEVHDPLAPESFFMGVESSSPARRVGVLVGCGLVAGVGWSLLQRRGRRLVSVDTAVRSAEPHLPVFTTMTDGLLQIITVALGSPLGREVAPRQLSATLGGWLAERSGLDVANRRLIIACGAGAGLAAVYNAPFGGAMFALESLLRSFRIGAAVVALATSVLAVVVATAVLGNRAMYAVPAYAPSASLITFAIVTGPLVGLVAGWFRRLERVSRARPLRGSWRLIASLANFTAIGLLAIPFPQLLGNGRTPAQLGFASELGIGLAAILLVLRIAITGSSLAAGARGGMLTPSLSNGALLAIVVGGVWSLLWPGAPLGAFAIIAATSFVASAMNIPLTAIVLVSEFTWIDEGYLVPMLLSVVTAVPIARVTGRARRAD